MARPKRVRAEFMLRVSPQMAKELQSLAAENGVSRNDLIEVVLLQFRDFATMNPDQVKALMQARNN